MRKKLKFKKINHKEIMPFYRCVYLVILTHNNHEFPNYNSIIVYDYMLINNHVLQHKIYKFNALSNLCLQYLLTKIPRL